MSSPSDQQNTCTTTTRNRPFWNVALQVSQVKQTSQTSSENMQFIITTYIPPWSPLCILLHRTMGLLFVLIWIPASALSKTKEWNISSYKEDVSTHCTWNSISITAIYAVKYTYTPSLWISWNAYPKQTDGYNKCIYTYRECCSLRSTLFPRQIRKLLQKKPTYWQQWSRQHVIG